MRDTAFMGEYAARGEQVYHRHLKCPDGQSILPHERLHGREAMEGRDYCNLCKEIDPLQKPSSVFGGSS